MVITTRELRLTSLGPERAACSWAARLAALSQSIRGYGHVKVAQAATVSASRDKLLAELRAVRVPQAQTA